jgi:DNA adenine methylase
MARRGQVVEAVAGRVPAVPFVKWAGGKWAISAVIEALLPADTRQRTYREPFLGGGAMFFRLQPDRAILTDALSDLIGTYTTVCAQVEALIKSLEKLEATHNTEQYYAIRERYNREKDASSLDRASWLIYLNKTCFNGLYRTNSKGEFNVPAGKFKTLTITEPEKLRLASAVLSHAELSAKPFEALLDEAEAGDVIYMDPPYVPTSKTSSFAGYNLGSFTIDDQIRLSEVFTKLDQRGCLLAMSNSDTDAVRDLYKAYDLHPIIAPRAISAKGSTRGDVTEILVRNKACVDAAARATADAKKA